MNPFLITYLVMTMLSLVVTFIKADTWEELIIGLIISLSPILNAIILFLIPASWLYDNVDFSKTLPWRK